MPPERTPSTGSAISNPKEKPVQALDFSSVDARGSSGTLKWVQLVGRLRALAVYTRMTTTGSTNTNTAGEHAHGYTR